jgi:hypothetical protein
MIDGNPFGRAALDGTQAQTPLGVTVPCDVLAPGRCCACRLPATKLGHQVWISYGCLLSHAST